MSRAVGQGILPAGCRGFQPRVSVLLQPQPYNVGHRSLPSRNAHSRPMVGTSRCDVPARVSAAGTNRARRANHAPRCASISRRGRRSVPSLPVELRSVTSPKKTSAIRYAREPAAACVRLATARVHHVHHRAGDGHTASAGLEMKGRKLLKRKIIRFAGEGPALESEKGYQRSARVLPEPFFVHSDLTTVVQIADLAAYCVNWGLRLKGMTEPTRTEIEPLARMVYDMKFVGKWFDELRQQEKPLYGVFYVDDLRPK